MNIYRSYFEKNNTIVSSSENNSARNQVTELVYGGDPKVFSRFIFKIDLNNLIGKINESVLNSEQVKYHNLHLTNTINHVKKLIGENVNDDFLRMRTSSFSLILFEIPEDWDEGSGYDLAFDNLNFKYKRNTNGSNWLNKKTGEPWTTPGVYNSTTVNIIETIPFDNGDENIDINLTTYINEVIFQNRIHHGLGIAFVSTLEEETSEKLYSVAFHTKYTNTVYEPYLESKFDTIILDDRNYFVLDRPNRLFFYAKRGSNFFTVDMTDVRIYNHNDQLIQTIPGTEVNVMSKGIYYIDLELSSEENIDSVLYYDEWNFMMETKSKSITNEFFLVGDENVFEMGDNHIKNEFSIGLSGIYHNSKIRRGEKLVVDCNIRKMYNQNYQKPLDLEYSIYIPQSDKTELLIVPFTKVNRAPNKYFILFDSTFLIESEYRIRLRLNNLDLSYRSQEVKFNVI